MGDGVTASMGFSSAERFRQRMVMALSTRRGRSQTIRVVRLLLPLTTGGSTSFTFKHPMATCTYSGDRAFLITPATAFMRGVRTIRVALVYLIRTDLLLLTVCISPLTGRIFV